ncbi:MAG TPA: putative toxin-antitoxin system toxin component, PIN family, partial [Planctomycetota bacterium]|nr:putative toxin-antitoxin system toxin component, PIN family [Planctomycetota bacterium]
MIRAVLDANILVSAILSPKGPPARVLAAAGEGRFLLLTSPSILEELGRVLLRPRLVRRHGWSEGETRAFLERLARLAVVTPGKTRLEAVKEDPADDRYIECAVEGSADYVVSGDAHVLGLGEYRGIRVRSPRQ